MLAALIALFTWWTAHLSPAPAPMAPAAAVRVTSQVSKPAPDTGSRPTPAAPAPAPDSVPECHGIEVWDGEHCVAEQLPAEAAGGDRDPAH